MPIYHYRCGRCPNDFEVHQSFAEPTLVWCADCEANELVRVLYAPTVFDATPRTVGSQAEHNEATGGRYWVDAQREAQKAAKLKARDEVQKSLPAGMETLRPEKIEKPWWRGTDTPNHTLNQLSDRQKTNYILTGDSRG